MGQPIQGAAGSKIWDRQWERRCEAAANRCYGEKNRSTVISAARLLAKQTRRLGRLVPETQVPELIGATTSSPVLNYPASRITEVGGKIAEWMAGRVVLLSMSVIFFEIFTGSR